MEMIVCILVLLSMVCQSCGDNHNVLFKSFDDMMSTDVKVNVDTANVINLVEEQYIGFTIDTSTFSPNGFTLNTSSVKLHTLMHALSPAILRVGGTTANWLFFNKPTQVLKSLHLKPGANVMTEQDLINLVGLTGSTGNRLLFDLNIELRYGDQWDPSNAIELLEFCSKMGFGDNMDWELGNEPFRSSPGKLIPENVARDFIEFSRLIRSYKNMDNSSLFGPDIGIEGLKFLLSVANTSGSFLKAFTFHHYYFAGGSATYKTYIDPVNFEKFPNEIKRVRAALAGTKSPHKRIWLGETSGAYNSGTPNVSDRFVSGFLWLDKLGISAQIGLGAVLRQTLCGGYYGLLDRDSFEPNPDYWLSWIHHQLVGRAVFNLTFSSSDFESEPTTRVYAHCTKPGSIYKSGAVTAFALNVHQDNTKLLSFVGSLSQQDIDVYLITPDETNTDTPVLSKNVKLNGKLLKMPTESSMPAIAPVSLPPGSKVALPPLTFGFFVFPNANVKACQ